MYENYEFSIVIFATKQEHFQLTYDSIRAQSVKRPVQLLIVPVEKAVFKKEYLEELKQDSHAVVIEPDADGNIMSALRESIKGKYVSFTKSGVEYFPKAIRKIGKKGKGNPAVIISAVKANVKRILPLREHNGYCDKYRRGTTLSTYANLLHRIYMGYFILAEKLCWQEDFYVKYWYYTVINMIYETVIRIPDLVCQRQRVLCIQDGTDIIAEENAFYQEQDNMEERFSFFFARMLQAAQKEGVLHAENAAYVLLYNAIRLMAMVQAKEKLPEEQVKVYTEYADGILRNRAYVQYIIANQYINKINKKYLLETYFPEAIVEDDEQVRNIVSLDKIRTNVEFFELKNQVIHAELKIMFPFGERCPIYITDGVNEVRLKEIAELKGVYWGRVQTGEYYLYECDLELANRDNLVQWLISVDGEKKTLDNLTFRSFTPLSCNVFLYKKTDGEIMYLNDRQDGVKVVEDKLLRRVPLCGKHIVSLISKKVPGCKALIARMLYHIRKLGKKKEIWILADRPNHGDDNGEVMFRYLCQQKPENVELYFVIDKSTPEWKILGKLGKMVQPFSRSHKLLFLLNDLSLSSQANKAVVNPFGTFSYLYRDLMYDKRLVFLQHGITKDNQSAWLNKYNRNLFGFVVNTQPEYDSIFEYDYFYKEDRVWLTGMPRFDKLYHDEKKYITVMPTWRKSLSAGTDSTGVWLLGEDFAKSEYFQFYNDLLNNERLLQAAGQYGYTVCFMPHPNTITGLELFKHDKRVKFLDASNSYRDVFAQTNLMITDYSSVAFDFAYLRKPIVYAQFDKEEFFSGEHSYTEGYFDYERDGFGEVEYTLEAVVDRAIEYMETDCAMKEEYLKRIDDTFAFNDQDCCKRVYEKILQYRGR